MFKMSIKSEGGKKGSKISCVETNTVAVTLEHWTLAAVTLESVQKTCGLRLHQRIGRSTKQVTMVGIPPRILRSRTLGGIAPVEENWGKSVSNAVYQLLTTANCQKVWVIIQYRKLNKLGLEIMFKLTFSALFSPCDANGHD